MHGLSQHATQLSIVAATCLVGLFGCEQPTAQETGPSYAELLSIYNSELQSLDRLEQKRETLISKHDAAMRPATLDATKALGALLSSAGEADEPLDQEDVTDTNALLDQAVAQAERSQEAASELLKSLGEASQPSEDELQKQAKLTEQFERDLAAIDKQIAEQKTRVEKARKARDAAEADGQ